MNSSSSTDAIVVSPVSNGSTLNDPNITKYNLDNIKVNTQALDECAGQILTALIPQAKELTPTVEQMSQLVQKRDEIAKAARAFQMILQATESQLAKGGQPIQTYQTGFGNEHQSEALPGALPRGQNNPQKLPYNLRAEQISGTSFTTPRDNNLRTWVYRMSPGVCIGKMEPAIYPNIVGSYTDKLVEANQLRWKPFPLPLENKSIDFVQSLTSIAGAGDPSAKSGLAYYYYSANTSMENKCFSSSDGDFLIVPQQGTLNIQTELGWLTVAPGSIVVIPSGLRFSVNINDKDENGKIAPARGYVAEVFNGHLRLPDLGPIGANGLANARDFCYPVASFENLKVEYKHVQKLQGKVFEAISEFSPYNVVAWHGNYAPYKYDLENFIAVNSVTKDHMDPSIFTVLSCPSQERGVALLDFVVFPPRWAVADDTFRPPYNHINVMSEFMGSIKGVYDGKAQGFLPGGASLHNCMINHGPDAGTVMAATNADLKPVYIGKGALQFMFESYLPLRLTEHALQHELLDIDYKQCWSGIKNDFDMSCIKF